MTTPNLWRCEQERIYNKTPLKIGVVGYSAQKFNEIQARTYIKRAFSTIHSNYGDQHYMIVVSGLTALGIPLIAYQEACERNWETKGIACEKAKEHPLFPVDETIIFGAEWGDESSLFLNDIDILVRVGGGQQTMQETALAHEKCIPVIEFDL